MGRTQEQENCIFEELLREYGAYELERRIQRRELARVYNRRWPYDQTTSKLPEEVLEWQADDIPNVKHVIESEEARTELFNKLTPAQQEIAVMLEQGYKPKDIAQERGDNGSGAVRWQKHNMKERLATVGSS